MIDHLEHILCLSLDYADIMYRPEEFEEYALASTWDI